MTGFAINPPQAPLGDIVGNKLMVSPEWYKFFVEIQRKIGGPSDPFDDSALLAALPVQQDEKIATAALAASHLVSPVSAPVEAAESLAAPQAPLEPFADRLEPYGAQAAAALYHNTAGSALTKVDDTNVTLTLGGTPSTALLRATSLTLGWTGQLAASRGGTGVSSLGNITRSNDTNVTLTLGGTPTGAVINSTSFTLGWTGTLAVSRGGSGAATLTGLVLGNGTSAFTAIVPGSGVTTALAVNVGSAGAFVTFNGALGTPSSGTLTNCTFPTLNQNTTGSAATLTTTRTIFGQNFNGSANVSGALTATSGSFSGQILHSDTSTDSRTKMLIRGTSKGLRLGTETTASWIDGVDSTGSGSYQPIVLNGSTVSLGISGSAVAVLSGTTFDMAGLIQCNSFRIDQTPTAETPVPTHTFTISLNGTTYRVPCLV